MPKKKNKKSEKNTCENLKICYFKNMKNKVEIDWFAKAVEEFGEEIVEDFCVQFDCFEPESFDESDYYAILWTEKP